MTLKGLENAGVIVGACSSKKQTKNSCSNPSQPIFFFYYTDVVCLVQKNTKLQTSNTMKQAEIRNFKKKKKERNFFQDLREKPWELIKHENDIH